MFDAVGGQYPFVQRRKDQQKIGDSSAGETCIHDEEAEMSVL